MWKRHLQQAFINLRVSKLRSFLAILGVLVGTAAVVTLISCGRMATEKALEQFRSLGTHLLAVSVFQNGNPGISTGPKSLSLEAWHNLSNNLPTEARIAPYGTAYQPISFAGSMLQGGAIIGADESLASIIQIELESGHFVSFVETYEHFCVIGDGIARQLHAIYPGNLLGKQLRIGHILYTIIGIAKPWKENGFFNENINQAIIVPVGGMALIGKENKISQAILFLNDDTSIDATIQRLTERIRAYSPQFNVFFRSAKQIITSMENQGQIFTLLLAVIGSISLFVGGIGVMNVMLVSVSERKKEIGIRKAIGARNREIQMLFIIESVILSVLGGLIGILFGLGVTAIIAFFSHWTFILFPLPLIAGFLISVATGIFFGFYPARRAAKLEPLVSLRNE